VLDVGTIGFGSSDIYAGHSVYSNVTSATVSIPANGVLLYVRLNYDLSTGWNHVDYTYTESGTSTLPSLTAPISGALLSGSTAFTWNPGAGPAEFQLYIGTIGAGSTNIYTGSVVANTVTSATVNIPANGVTVYVTLNYLFNGAWKSINYTYTEAGTPTLPSLSSPTSGSLVGGATAFTWNPGAGPAEFMLYVGTSGVGGTDLYKSAVLAGTVTSQTVTIPSNGATIYVQLSYLLNDVWQSINYTFTETGSPGPPSLTSPTPGSTLSGTSTTFTWNPGTGSSQFVLYVGTTGVGSSDIYSGHSVYSNVTSATVTIPANGVLLYVRLNYDLSTGWNHVDFTYTESGTPTLPSLTGPISGTLLSGSTAFTWNSGAGPAEFQLYIGTIGAGSTDIYAGGAVANTVTSAAVSIPASGVLLYVRLNYELSGVWQHVDYTYTESGTPTLPSLTGPISGTLLSGSTAFTWNPGAGPAEFKLYVGIEAAGSSDIYAGGAVANTVTSSTVSIPANGATVYVTLNYLLNGVWNSINYTYTEAGTPTLPSLTSPASGSLVGGPTVFTWNPGGGPTQFVLYVGTTGVGSSDIYSGKAVWYTVTSATVSIPANGVLIYVRLNYQLNGVWHHIDYTYTES
jgi:hypothetical protein